MATTTTQLDARAREMMAVHKARQEAVAGLIARARYHLAALERQFASAMEREEVDRSFVTEILGAMHALRAEIKHLEG